MNVCRMDKLIYNENFCWFVGWLVGCCCFEHIIKFKVSIETDDTVSSGS